MEITPLKLSSNNGRIVDAIICWMLLVSIQLLGVNTLLNALPKNEVLLAGKIALEIIPIITLLYMPRTSIISNMIDLCVYALVFKCVLLGSYFSNGDLYSLLYDAPSVLLMNFLYVTGFIRVVWFSFNEGGIRLIDWPPIGPVSFASRSSEGQLKPTKDECIWVVVALIIALELAAIAMNKSYVWFDVLPAGICLMMIIMIIFFAPSVRARLLKTIDQQADDAHTIEQYEALIERAAAEIVRLRAYQPPDDDNATDNTYPAAARTQSHLTRVK
jgi:hypothetical protein